MAPSLDTPTEPTGSVSGDLRQTAVRGLRSVLGDSAIYGISVGILPAALVLATPIIARRVGPDGFGAIDLLSAVLTLASAFAILGMDTGLARSYFDYGHEQSSERGRVIRTAFTTVFAVSAIVSLILAIVTLFLAEALHQQPSAVSIGAAIVAFLLLPFSNGVIMAREVFRLERDRRRYVLTTAFQAVGVGAAVLLIVAGAGPAGYFSGLLLGSLLALAYCLRTRRFLSRGRMVDRAQLRTMLAYGLPLVPAALATWVTFAVDRALLASMRGLFDVGYYALASKIAAPLFMALNAFTVAWLPFILNQPPQRQLELRARAMTAVAAAAGIGYVGILLFTPQLINLLGGPAFHRSTRAVPGIALGWLFWGLAFVLATEFVISRRTRVVGLGTLAAAVANVLLNLVLIPRYGFAGAAWSTAATFGLLAAIYFVIERRAVNTPYRWGRLSAIAAVLVVASAFLLRSGGSLDGRISLAAVASLVLAGVAATDREHAPRRPEPAEGS
jgi:O-antigen/teichoic acid export membrane protein